MELTRAIIAAAIDVHRELGPGLLESAYAACMAWELTSRGLRFERERPVPIIYKGRRLDVGYRLDLIVENRVIVELKAVTEFTGVHTAQVLTYLRLTNRSVGLLLNFNVPVLTKGIRRISL